MTATNSGLLALFEHWRLGERKRFTPTEMREAICEAWRNGADNARAPLRVELQGCGDNGCVVATTRGMGTNGGCTCDERTLRRAVLALKAELERRQA